MPRKRKPRVDMLPPMVSRQEMQIVLGEFAANMKWLQIHFEQYTHKWVALENGKLLVSGDTCEDIAPFIDKYPGRTNVLRVHVGHDYHHAISS